MNQRWSLPSRITLISSSSTSGLNTANFFQFFNFGKKNFHWKSRDTPVCDAWTGGGGGSHVHEGAGTGGRAQARPRQKQAQNNTQGVSMTGGTKGICSTPLCSEMDRAPATRSCCCTTANSRRVQRKRPPARLRHHCQRPCPGGVCCTAFLLLQRLRIRVTRSEKGARGRSLRSVEDC